VNLRGELFLGPTKDESINAPMPKIIAKTISNRMGR